MAKKKNKTCEHKYKIGNSVYCKIGVGGDAFCSSSVSKCQSAVRISSRTNRAYYSFQQGRLVMKDGSEF